MTGISVVGPELKDVAGLVVWWTMRGLVPFDSFEEWAAFEGLPLDLCPAKPAPAVKLSRAAASQAGPRRLLRPLARRGHWELVDEVVLHAGTTKHVPVVAGHYDEAAGLPSLRALTPDGERLAALVEGELPRFWDSYASPDLSSWLIRYLERVVGGVSLRERGGFYFVPRDRIEQWRAARDVLRRCSAASIWEMPAMRTDEAVAAVLDAAAREADSAFADVEAYLADARREVGTVRSVQLRIDKARSAQAKVARYVELLGQRRPELDHRAEQLLGALQAAMLAAEAKARADLPEEPVA